MVYANVPPLARRRLSPAETDEMQALGILSPEGEFTPRRGAGPRRRQHTDRTSVVEADALNAVCAYTLPAYRLPALFTDGLQVPLGELPLLRISGAASVDETGCPIHAGDFRAQCWRTYRNITRLLKSAGTDWDDVVRTTCYLRDIERDYDDFNDVRSTFFQWLHLDPLPASTSVQARLGSDDLRIEIECCALVPAHRGAAHA